MEIKEELKKAAIKNCTCYYFDDIIRDFDINFRDILSDQNYIKIFHFMTFHTKL